MIDLLKVCLGEGKIFKPRMIINWFWTPITFRNQIKIIVKYCLLFVLCVWILKDYSLFEKLALIGLLKIFGIKNHYSRMFFFIQFILNVLCTYL